MERWLYIANRAIAKEAENTIEELRAIASVHKIDLDYVLERFSTEYQKQKKKLRKTEVDET